jgi:CBS domain-containing protein
MVEYNKKLSDKYMKNTKNNAAYFRELFQKWEKYLTIKYEHSRRTSLGQMITRFWRKEAKKCRLIGITMDDLWNIKRIRNVDAHDKELIVIQDKAVQKLKKIVNAFCARAADIATPGSRMYCVGPDTRAEDVVREINEKSITHVPVVEGEDFYGIFSGKTLLKLVAEDRYDENLVMGDIKDELRSEEDAGYYEFLPTDSDLFEVYRLFREYIDEGKRLGVIFLTAGGGESGEIEGLITAWDLNK